MDVKGPNRGNERKSDEETNRKGGDRLILQYNESK